MAQVSTNFMLPLYTLPLQSKARSIPPNWLEFIRLRRINNRWQSHHSPKKMQNTATGTHLSIIGWIQLLPGFYVSSNSSSIASAVRRACSGSSPVRSPDNLLTTSACPRRNKARRMSRLSKLCESLKCFSIVVMISLSETSASRASDVLFFFSLTSSLSERIAAKFIPIPADHINHVSVLKILVSNRISCESLFSMVL